MCIRDRYIKCVFKYLNMTYHSFPLVDLTNIYPLQNGLANLKHSATLAIPKSCSAAKFMQCPHFNKIKSDGYSNCTDCGAFISRNGVAAIKEEGRKGKIEYEMSAYVKNMIAKQDINRKYTSVLTHQEISTRKKLVDWLCELGESVHISLEYIHKAIVYLDVIMDENTIEEADLEPLGIVCLLLAAKMGEKDEQVLRLQKAFQQRIHVSRREIRKYEMQVLALLKWDLQCTTPMDFIQLFSYEGLILENDKVDHKASTKKTIVMLRQYVEFLADMCLQEYEMLKVTSVRSAAGIISTARRILKFENAWSEELAAMTGVSYEEVVPIADCIFKTYMRLFGKKREAKNVDIADSKLAGVYRSNNLFVSAAVRCLSNGSW
eukprot:TRINITY_DN1702_c0_g4_i2.p1 TRINITY_DN1702_c0_g4~~TRINITY_DN1702_c0_g4_i2.p1  ORF type:complete len:392 (-),score=49.52 TRINITY_DN1702_c0_g4_i2:137-1267(-)